MLLHEAKETLQHHFSDGLVIIVGSGLSCAEGLPGMGELSAHLRAEVSSLILQEEQALWAEILNLIDEKGLEPALLAKAPTPAIEAAIAKCTGTLVGLREQQALDEVFSGKRVLRLTRLIPHLLKPSSGIPFITTNYDRLVEIAIEEAGLGVDTMFCGRFSGEFNERESRMSFCRDVAIKGKTVKFTHRQKANIFKPHGSLDWYLRNDKPISYMGPLSNGTRLIITPGHNKFRNGYNSPFDVHRARANSAIDRAQRFLILGYGFNDDHLETHLAPAIRAGKPTVMLTRSLTDSALAVATGNENVISLDHYERGGHSGTRLISGKNTTDFPDLHMWDLGSFITEILEP